MVVWERVKISHFLYVISFSSEYNHLKLHLCGQGTEKKRVIFPQREIEPPLPRVQYTTAEADGCLTSF